MHNWLCRLLLFTLTACASAPAQELSLWGRIHTLAEAEQPQAPALWVQPDGQVTTAWIGADTAGVHQDARAISGTDMGSAITLPLPPVHPKDQVLLPAAEGKLHLLWLDANRDGESRLYAALLTSELTVERGPTAISDRQTLRSTAVAQPNGQILTIWSGGLPAEPALYLQRVDERGLPRTPRLLVSDADWPALTQTNEGTLFLFWRRPSDGRLQAGQLEGDQLADVKSMPDFTLERGDRLHQVFSALDATHIYLFWNVTRASSTNETWMTNRLLTDAIWSSPGLVGIGERQAEVVQTGLNSGAVISATDGNIPLIWAAPMRGQFDVLPVAGRIGSDVAVAYFRAGAIVGYQRIAPVQALIGPPLLLPDRDRYLYLAWADALDTGRAALKLTSSRG